MFMLTWGVQYESFMFYDIQAVLLIQSLSDQNENVYNALELK